MNPYHAHVVVVQTTGTQDKLTITVCREQETLSYPHLEDDGYETIQTTIPFPRWCCFTQSCNDVRVALSTPIHPHQLSTRAHVWLSSSLRFARVVGHTVCQRCCRETVKSLLNVEVPVDVCSSPLN